MLFIPGKNLCAVRVGGCQRDQILEKVAQFFKQYTKRSHSSFNIKTYFSKLSLKLSKIWASFVRKFSANTFQK